MTVPKAKTNKKTLAKKIDATIVEPVIDLVEEVKVEANKDVTTFTIDKWHVLLAAVVVTVAALVFIL